MSQSGEMIRLGIDDLEGYTGNDKPQRGRNGKVRYYCPVHGGDQQRSFEVRPNGGFKCFSCGVWGYIKELNQDYQPKEKGHGFSTKPPPKKGKTETGKYTHVDITKYLPRYQEKIGVDSPGDRYLEIRKISKELAIKHGLGWARDGEWCHFKNGQPVRQWIYGRLVVPHTDIEGNVVNLYGRAVGRKVPKEHVHSHLPGDRGIFNARGLLEETVYITEGAFDALSLLECGYNAVAIFGLSGLRPNWIKARNIIFAMDQDAAGESWKKIAYQVRLLGKRVMWLNESAYRGCKDLSETLMTYGMIELPEIGTNSITLAMREAAVSTSETKESLLWDEYIQLLERDRLSWEVEQFGYTLPVWFKSKKTEHEAETTRLQQEKENEIWNEYQAIPADQRDKWEQDRFGSGTYPTWFLKKKFPTTIPNPADRVSEPEPQVNPQQTLWDEYCLVDKSERTTWEREKFGSVLPGWFFSKKTALEAKEIKLAKKLEADQWREYQAIPAEQRTKWEAEQFGSQLPSWFHVKKITLKEQEERANESSQQERLFL